MAVASGILVMLLLLLLGDWDSNTSNVLWRAGVSGVLVGGVVGIGIWYLGELLKSELVTAITYIEDLPNARASIDNSRMRFGLDLLIRQVEKSIDGVQSKLKRTEETKRDLYVKLHIAESEAQQLSSVLNALNDAVIVSDAFNEVTIANTAAEELLKFDLKHAKQTSIDCVIDDHTLCNLIKETREGNIPRHKRQVEQRVKRGNQETIYDITLSCVQRDEAQRESNCNNCNAGVVTILRDVTREKEIAESKSDFVSNVSHELRTPLSSIKAYMEMLVDGEADDEQTKAKFYNIIQGETNRLSRLIDNILNISRIESGVVRVQREHMSLGQVIRESVNIMQPQARAKQIELMELGSPDYFQVFADRDMILQCALNLLSNAIKYTQAGGRVSISASVDGHAKLVRVTVNDNGVGIPEKYLPHLFDKFYRVADHKKLAKGTGLGLNLVRHVIETVHGGEVNVESTVDRGSTFTFALPIADTE